MAHRIIHYVSPEEFPNEVKKNIPGLFLILGFALIVISLFTFATNLPKLKEDITRLGWTAAEAKITDTYVDTSDSSGAPEESVYCVVYEYTANSQPYYGTASDPDRAKKVGDSLEIRYNLESPPESFCTLNSYAKLWKTVALSGASGVVILIAMSIIDKSRKEKAKAEEE